MIDDGPVAGALPAAWEIAFPQQVRATRLAGASAALHRQRDDHEDFVAEAAELTRSCMKALPWPGRPMAVAQAGLPRPPQPLEALWHDCLTLREYRGDRHLAAVGVLGLVWPEPHLLPGRQVDAHRQQYRGWDDDTWRRAAERPTVCAASIPRSWRR